MVNKITSDDIIELFCNDYGKALYLREIATLLKKPHQSIKPYVESLVKEKILLKKERLNIIEYKLNFENKLVYDHLVIAEKKKLMKKLKEEVYISLIYEKFSVHFNRCTLVIFGSAAEKVKEKSDIDLLVIGKIDLSEEKDFFFNVYNKELHITKAKNLNELGKVFTIEIYKKHIILNDTEKMVRYFGELHEQNKLV